MMNSPFRNSLPPAPLAEEIPPGERRVPDTCASSWNAVQGQDADGAELLDPPNAALKEPKN
jgi:hypothetical protein